MIRRFIFDSQLGAVVELGQHVHRTLSPGDRDAEASEAYRASQNESTGSQLRRAALERAERRQWAHKRYGTESRWRE